MVVPALLSHPPAIDALVHRLLQHHLANTEAHALFALLSDWSDEDPASLMKTLKKQSDYYNYHKRTVGDFIDDVSDKGWGATVADRTMWAQMKMNPTDIADVSGATYTFLINGHTPDSNWTGLFRPGEKLHEAMCPADDSYHTYEYDDHFVIAPSINFSSRSNDFTVNAVNERGRKVELGFEYNSRDNSEFLSVAELAELNRQLGLQPDPKGWRTDGPVAATHVWQLRLVADDGSWRLVGRYHPGDTEVTLAPALAAP